MKVAYLASKQSLPGEANRQVDLAEHQQMMALLQPAFAAENSIISDVAWDEKSVNWAEFDAVIIGSTWDYCDRYDDFLTTLKEIDKVTPVFNSPDLVAWNSHKGYLKVLAQRGVDVIPTVWLDEPSEAPRWDEIFRLFDVEKLVVKRQVGANAEGQFLLEDGDGGEGGKAAPTLTHPMMVQPFMHTITEDGEYSFVFIAGELSHSLVKRARQGDYRIQASYGGTEQTVKLDDIDVLVATSVLTALETVPLYARVDMLRGPSGKLLLMELELIEPFLYPLQSTQLGSMMVKALKQRLE